MFQCIRCCDGGDCCGPGGCFCSCSEECCIPLGEVKGQVNCSPSTLTHHLNTLRDAGLIETERRGRDQFIRVVPETLANVVRFLQERPTSCSIDGIQMEEKSYVDK